jgi:phosphoglycolate phosphatase
VFDLDGTLVDTLPDVAFGVNKALEQMGHSPLSLEQVKKAVGPGKDEFIRAIFPGVQNPEGKMFLSLFREIYWEHCLDETRLFSGMGNVLIRLENRKLGVASNKPRTYTEKILEGLGIRSRFDDVLGPEDVVHAKPHPEMIIKLMERVDGIPSQTLLVGDTDMDILAGRGAGIGVCGVRYGYGRVADMERLYPDFFIDSPEELLSILENHRE